MRFVWYKKTANSCFETCKDNKQIDVFLLQFIICTLVFVPWSIAWTFDRWGLSLHYIDWGIDIEKTVGRRNE